jgi:hypothetical protein
VAGDVAHPLRIGHRRPAVLLDDQARSHGIVTIVPYK